MIFLQLLPLLKTLSKFGATGFLFGILVYVVWEFVIKRERQRSRELEEDNTELEEKVESLENKIEKMKEKRVDQEITYLEDEIEKLENKLKDNNG